MKKVKIDNKGLNLQAETEVETIETCFLQSCFYGPLRFMFSLYNMTNCSRVAPLMVNCTLPHPSKNATQIYLQVNQIEAFSILFLSFFFSKMVSHYIDLAVLELTI